jgi:succinate dehydrogenase / fumarate reductase cytochrome b subunit
MFGSLWAIWYQTLAGMRHLIWDNAIGLDLETAEKLGWAVVFGSFGITAVSALIMIWL